MVCVVWIFFKKTNKQTPNPNQSTGLPIVKDVFLAALIAAPETWKMRFCVCQIE